MKKKVKTHLMTKESKIYWTVKESNWIWVSSLKLFNKDMKLDQLLRVVRMASYSMFKIFK